MDRAAGADSYRAAVQALRDGEIVGVFPEATISRSFELKEFKSGAARMALESGTPIVPMVIWGSQRVWTKGFPSVWAGRHPHLDRGRRADRAVRTCVGDDGVAASRMEELLRCVQANYEHPAGEYGCPPARRRRPDARGGQPDGCGGGRGQGCGRRAKESGGA